MTPNFALLLSVDGIVLLHRVPDGWHRAGEVSTASETLSDDMGHLLKTAQSLGAGDIRTKLILPNDQIRFMAIDTALTTLDDIHAAVTDATPLGLDEIIVDFDRTGGRTHIAAVAKQTVLEAETFAREHGFEPVSCVAVAEPYTFSGEVFFGPTTYARAELGIGADLSREDSAPVETGQIETGQIAVPQATPDADVATAETPETPVVVDDTADDLPVFASRNRKGEIEDTPLIQFTRREPAVVSDTKKPDEAIVAAPAPIRATPPEAPAAVAPRAPAKDRSATGKAKRGGLLAGFGAAKPAPTPPPSATDAALARGVAQSHVSKGKPKYLGASLTVLLIATMGLVGIWANRQVDGGVASLLEVDPGLQEDTAPVVAAPVIAPAPAPAPDPVVEALVAEPDPKPVVVEDDTPPTPIVTAVPGRVLSPADAARIYAATGVWQRAPRLPGEPSEAEQSTLAGLHDFAPVDTISDIARPSGLATTSLNHELPILAPRNPVPAGLEVLRDDNGFILASASGTILPTGVPIYGRAPALRPPVRPGKDDPALDDAALPIVPDMVVSELQFVAYIPESDLPPARAFRAPELSQPVPLILPTEDAPRGLAGARFITPPPPAAPETVDPIVEDVAATPAIVPEEVTLEAELPADVADAPEADVDTDTPDVAEADLDTPEPDAPDVAEADAGTPELDAPDVAEADAETPLAEESFVEVIQGSPAIVPPLRPGTETDTQALAEATPEQPVDADTTTPLVQDPALAGLKPLARPGALAPASVATFEATPELAGIRPSVRPAGLAPDAPEAPEETATVTDPAITNSNEISAIVASIAAAAPPSQIINPTRSAIALSPRPDPRPANFARVVASAQTLQQRQTTRAAAASTSAAVAQQTAPATAPATGGQTAVTVARAATVDNALTLRNINLIGVYGKPGARRALVRMPNGRFVKVEVGSSLDGGRVTAIGDSALNFVKRGQTYALQLPAG